MAWWDHLGKSGKGVVTAISIAFGALGSAFALGAATSGAVGDVKQVPIIESRLTTAEAKLVVHDTAIARINRVDSVANRNKMALDTLTADMRDVKCILTATARGTDPLRCLSTYRGGP